MLIRSCIVTCMILLLWGGRLDAAVPFDGMVKEFRLPNGIKLLVVQRHSSPTVAAWIRYHVGSVHERSDERGIAHLLEHMLFKGTRHLGTKDFTAERPILDQIERIAQRLHREKSKGRQANQMQLRSLEKQLKDLEKKAERYVVKDEFFELYARHGASGYNAFTSKDSTTYLISLPSHKLELWAAIESDRMKQPVLREFYTERAVVMEERKRSYDAEPSAKLWESFIATAFNAHPYGQPIIGWSSDIQYLTRTKAESFLKRYYAPNNATIVLVGDVQAEAALQLVTKYFSTIPAGQPVPSVPVQEEPQQGERRVTIQGDAEPELLIGFHKTAQTDPDDVVFDMIAGVLTQGKTARLHRRLVVERQLATSVTVFDAPGQRFPNLFVIHASPRAPHTSHEVEQAIYQELAGLVTEPVSAAELNRVKNLVAYKDAQLKNSNSGLARVLADYETVTGSWRSLQEYLPAISWVTAADISRVASHYFTDQNRIVGILSTRRKHEANINK